MLCICDGDFPCEQRLSPFDLAEAVQDAEAGEIDENDQEIENEIGSAADPEYFGDSRREVRRDDESDASDELEGEEEPDEELSFQD